MSGGSKGYNPQQTGQGLGKKLDHYINTPAPAPSVGTTSGISSLLGAANNPEYASGIQGAIKSFADTAAGKNIGVNAPGYQAVRDGIRSDVMGDVNTSVGAYGRAGSNVHTSELTRDLTQQLGALDMGQYNSGLDRQTTAAGMLPALQTASTQPGLTQLTAGQVADENADPNYGRFKELLAAFNGSQGSPGLTPETPWWQTALGYIAGNAGNAIKAAAGRK